MSGEKTFETIELIDCRLGKTNKINEFFFFSFYEWQTSREMRFDSTAQTDEILVGGIFRWERGTANHGKVLRPRYYFSTTKCGFYDSTRTNYTHMKIHGNINALGVGFRALTVLRTLFIVVLSVWAARRLFYAHDSYDIIRIKTSYSIFFLSLARPPPPRPSNS